MVFTAEQAREKVQNTAEKRSAVTERAKAAANVAYAAIEERANEGFQFAEFFMANGDVRAECCKLVSDAGYRVVAVDNCVTVYWD